MKTLVKVIRVWMYGCMDRIVYVRRLGWTLHQQMRNISRSCSGGYAQTIPGVFTPGITLQRIMQVMYPGYYPTNNSASYVTHSYPYPERLEVLYDSHTRTRNFWKFCTPVPQTPGVRVCRFHNLCELCMPVLQNPELL